MGIKCIQFNANQHHRFIYKLEYDTNHLPYFNGSLYKEENF